MDTYQYTAIYSYLLFLIHISDGSVDNCFKKLFLDLQSNEFSRPNKHNYTDLLLFSTQLTTANYPWAISPECSHHVGRQIYRLGKEKGKAETSMLCNFSKSEYHLVYVCPLVTEKYKLPIDKQHRSYIIAAGI